MSGLSDAERLDWLRLARTDTVGPVTFAHLIRRYHTAAEATGYAELFDSDKVLAPGRRLRGWTCWPGCGWRPFSKPCCSAS